MLTLQLDLLAYVWDMREPVGVIFYATACVVILLVTAIGVRVDGTRYLGEKKICSSMSAYDVAFLRRGHKAVLFLAFYKLVKFAFLEPARRRKDGLGKFVCATGHPDLGGLSRLERAVFDACARPMSFRHLLKTTTLRKAAQDAGEQINQSLVEAKLIRRPMSRQYCRKIGLAGGCVITWVGVSVFFVEPEYQSVIRLIGLFALLSFPFAAWPPRVTHLGLRCLAAMQDRSELLLSSLQGHGSLDRENAMMLVAAHGPRILKPRARRLSMSGCAGSWNQPDYVGDGSLSQPGGMSQFN